MKLLSAKKLKRFYYRITVSFNDMNYKKEVFVRKSVYVSFLGIPLYPTKDICVRPTQAELLELN